MTNKTGALTRRHVHGLLLGATALATWGGVASAQADQTLVVAQTSDAQPANILPGRAGNWPWRTNVFETLAYLDPETFEPVAQLATDWQVSDDKLSMDITLRDDVTFHTGRKMTAEDVKWSFETAASPESSSQVGFIARDFAAIEVTGDTTLTIRFSHPTGNIFDFFEFTSILDRETYDNRTDGSQVVGTGPYRFVSWTPGASVVLERFDGYRDPEAAAIPRIEFAVIGDPTAVVSALRSGRAAVAYGLPSNQLIEFDRNPMYQTIDGGGVIYPFGVNVTTPPFDVKEVRQAVQYAIDRQRIVDQVFDGKGTATDLFWSPTSPGYSEDLATQYAYDPEKARQMIEAAGATAATVKIVVPAIPANRSIFEIVQNNLREVGLSPEAEVLEVADYDKRQVAGDLGQAFILIHGQVGFSSTTLISSLPSLREGNPSQFWSEEYQTLRAAMDAAQTTDEQAKAVADLSEYMNDQAFNLALLQTPNSTVISSDLKGMTMNRFGGLNFANATLN